jgi:hypothetical protein
MSDLEKSDRIFTAISSLNTLVRNVHLYPPSSKLIRDSLVKAHQTLTACWQQGADSFSLSVFKGRLFCNGRSLEAPHQKNPSVSDILQIMVHAGIERLSFKRGVSQDELSSFVFALNDCPEQYATSGKLEQSLNEKGRGHIVLLANDPLTVGPTEIPEGGPPFQGRQGDTFSDDVSINARGAGEGAAATGSHKGPADTSEAPSCKISKNQRERLHCALKGAMPVREMFFVCLSF